MIVAGIATVKERELLFRKALSSIYRQVNKVFVVLNGYDKLPDWITLIPNVKAVIADNSKGDAGKFLFTPKNEDCYFFSFDDDILFPRTYVADTIAAIDKYDGIVSYHGRVYPRPFVDYKMWAENYRCMSPVIRDTPVDIVGTGCCAFNTNRFKVDINDFPNRNMADVFVSVLAHQQNVPMWVLAHQRGYFHYLFPKGDTIWHTEVNDTSRQTNLLRQVLV